ncbi:hypothetical protein C731_3235 [Mycolicibacterium hassiacum DSM 44199]|uniref:Uncharacterized protein n=1 Tax=Mycolicibacterium hassiacum (strain DSM 44199 / CIP 105218 / JCM 12690 / 3849) TaxID=1122247 RepID=K5BAT4_MYCHD|nr:hypothetical protein C731_3235 [Mycolicibacterium hassiacum DSM 44199]
MAAMPVLVRDSADRPNRHRPHPAEPRRRADRHQPHSADRPNRHRPHHSHGTRR